MNVTLAAQVQKMFGHMNLDQAYMVEELEAAGVTDLTDRYVDTTLVSRIRLTAEAITLATSRPQPELMSRISRLRA